MSYIKVENLSMNFGVVKALRNVSFEMEKGRVIALCGENGAGKSTLAKIMAGVHPYGSYQGKIMIDGEEIRYANTREAEKACVAIVHQELNQFHNMTVAENIFMGVLPNSSGVVNKRALFKNAQEIIDKFRLGIRSDQMLSELSISKRQLIEIVKAVNRSCELIIFDEASSSLTEGEVAFLFDLIRDLKEKNITMIYVTHKLGEVFEICDDIVVLKDGEFVQKAEVKDTDNDMLVKWMVGRELKKMFPDYNEIQDRGIALELKNWNVVQNKKQIISKGDFYLKKGEILGFYGLVGAGRTELFHSLFSGEDIASGSQLYLEGKETKIRNTKDAINKRIGMLTEDRKGTGLVLTQNIRENVSVVSLRYYADRFGAIKERILKEDVIKMADRLKVKTPTLEQSITKLSGGNQQKTVFSKWLLSKPDILILDEPTRGIDVGTKIEIYQMLRELADNGISIVFISSEMVELMGVCDRIYVMKAGEIVSDVRREDFSEDTLLKLAM